MAYLLDMNRNELLAAAKRERALGNTLVAACLHDAAYGNFPVKKRVTKMPKILNTIREMPAAEMGGWIGMLLIHGATIPVTVSNIMGWSSQLPPLSMVLLVWAGLALFLWRAIARNDTLYIVSNAVGFVLNSVLLALIVFPWG